MQGRNTFLIFTKRINRLLLAGKSKILFEFIVSIGDKFSSGFQELGKKLPLLRKRNSLSK
jgi:hypothetical protein